MRQETALGTTETELPSEDLQNNIPKQEQEKPVFIFADDKKMQLKKYIGREEYVTIPEDVLIICDGAFAKNRRVKSVNCPASLLQIGSFAFENCAKLESVNIKYGLVSIGAKAFFNCGNMTLLQLPKSIENIGICAFEKCFRLVILLNYERR
jgi:hypothetical protein